MPKTTAAGIHSPRLHLIMYSLLLVATPFVLLQNFLVEKISGLSATIIPLAGLEIPLMPLLAAVIVVGLILALRPYITRIRLLGVLIIVLMLALSNQISDYYFDHNFYDLQQNWHYLAYGIFAHMVYRDLAPRKVAGARIMLVTYLLALGFSTFDEIFQMHLSSRVFDVGDIGKDLWGALMGIVFLYFTVTDKKALVSDWKRVRWKKSSDYFKHRASLLILMFVFALLFLSFGSLLSEYRYSGHVVLLTAICFLVLFLLFHLSQFRPVKYALVAIVAGLVVIQAWSYFTYRSENIVRSECGLTVYKGFPILFFDAMIFPDGSFRLVDKKDYFNSRDQNFFKRQEADILIIGGGATVGAGYGFPAKAPVQFIYNQYTQRALQVVVLENPRACELYNRLKGEGKNVLFIIHHAC